MKKVMVVFFLVCMLVCCVCIFPIGVVRKDRNVDSTLGITYGKTENGQELKQIFVAQTGYLSEIAFDITFPYGKPEEGNLIFCLCREKDGKVLLERTIPLQDVNNDAFTFVSVNKWLSRKDYYSYTVRVEAGSEWMFQGVYTETESDAAQGSYELKFDDEVVKGQAVSRYVYGYLLNYKNVICLWAFIFVVGLILMETCTGKKPLADNRLLSKADDLLTQWQLPILFFELVIILLLIIRICRNEAVHWDEAFTWKMVTKNDLLEMFRATAADVHPPLYYMILMAAMSIFGQSIFVAKMVSVSGALATCILGLTLVRKRWGGKVAIPFLMVTGLGTQMIYYNVDVRMYSWLIFFVLASGLFAYEIMQTGKKRWWAAFTLAALGGVYTQYFAVVPLAFIYLFLGFWMAVNDRAQVKKWLICCLVTVLGYVPWLAVVIETIQRDATALVEENAPVTFRGLCQWAFQSNIELSEYMPVVVLAAATVCLAVRYRDYSKKERTFMVFSGVLPFLSLGICMMFMANMHHFWDNRYLVHVLLFLWLFLLIILAGRSLLTWGVGMIWLSVLVLSSYTVMQATEFNTIPWIQQAKQLLAQVQEEEKIVYTFNTFDVLYEYYVPNAEFIWYEDADFTELGDEFYVIAWGGGDFPRELYQEGFLEREVVGGMRLEEGITAELWKITVHWEKKESIQ